MPRRSKPLTTMWPELESKLSGIAAERGRNTESLVFDAVERLVGQIASEIAKYTEWFLGEVEKGIAAADQGEFIEHVDVRTLIDTRYRKPTPPVRLVPTRGIQTP
jgi:predicted transcriptional regulator